MLFSVFSSLRHGRAICDTAFFHGRRVFIYCTAGQAKRRKNDGPLYLEAVDLTLRETSQLGSVPSSEWPKKITATKELVLPENQLVKKKAMALQA